jgi:hypothetical protein
LKTSKEEKLWIHNCKASGPTGTAIGEPCNWCDVTMEDVEEETLFERHDILKEPK